MIEIADQFQSKIVQRQSSSHVERRHIRVCDQEAGFRGIGENQDQTTQRGGGRAGLAFIEEGAKPAENIVLEGTGEEAIHLEGDIGLVPLP